MTSFGINNEGQLVFDYYHEDIDQLDDANVYNGQNSTLWVNFRQAFADEIKETYQDLRNNGFITYDKLEDRFITQGSDKWSEAIYNEDGDFKYISMLRSDNDATNLPQVRGSGEEHFRYFIENRLNYCDSKWYASDYANDYISLRIYTPSTWSSIAPNPAITVTPFSNMYAGVRYKANGALYQERATHGVPVTFRPKGETFESENNESFNDTETAVYGAHQLSSIGDLAPLYCGSINVSNADKLIELKVGDATEGYSNANLRELSVGTNKLLKKIDVRNCPNFASVLALSNCPGIEEVYATGTAITGVEFPESGCLRIAHLPASIANLTIKHQLYIEDLTIAGYSSLKTLWIENCPTVDALDILSKATNADRVRLTDLDLKYDSAAEMLALATRSIGGIDENGVNIDKMWLDGKCHIKALTGSELATIVDAFPYLTITYEVLTSNLIFMSEDGSTELGRQLIQNGADGNYTGNIPTKDSTAQYHFTFAGWSLTPGGSVDADALKNVEADRYVYAAFSGTLRSYTVKFYNGSTLLQTVTVKYGTTAAYTGDTPVNNSSGNPADFEFYGWNPAPTNIQGDTNCYAQFHDLREITDSWATIAQAVVDGTATDKYAIGAFKMLDIGVKDLPYDFEQSSAVIYNDEIHILGSSVSAYRTSHYKWTGTEWVEVSTLPYEFYYGSAVVYNNEIHIFGGSSSSSGRTKHYKWDGSSWTSVSTLPYKFSEGIAIVYNNEIHIMSSVVSSNYTSHYKWTGSEWTEVGVLPYNLYTASAVIYNNELHVLGSYDSNHDTSHYKWNGSTWTSVSTLPQKLSNGHALVVGTDIYMIQWDEFYKYDGTSWSTVPEVPANVYEGCSVVLDGVIYVMGSSISENRKVFFSYTPETETWSKVGITESIPMEVIAHNHDELPDGVGKWESIAKPTNIPQYGCAVTYQNEVHALGGNSSSSYTQHIKWDATNSAWVTVSTLPYQFRSGCAVILNDEIHILGSYQTTNKTDHYKWNATDGWVSVSTLPYSFYCSSAVVLNNEIHILGSYDSSSRKYHYKWNGTEWASVSTLPYNFYYGSAVVYNGEIHIFSGSGSSTGHYKWDGSAWTSVSTLPYNLQYGVATIINNEIHIFGGSGNRTGHYKWNGTEWTSMTTLPGNFENYPLAVCNGTPYIFISTSCYKLAGPSWEKQVDCAASCQLSGGALLDFNNELHALGYNGHYKWNGSAWVKICDNPYPRYYTATIVYDGAIHSLGNSYPASNANASYNKSHYKFDGTEWTLVGEMPYAGDSGKACVWNGELYAFLGKHFCKYDGSSWTEISSSTPVSSGGNSQMTVYNNEIYISFGNGSKYALYRWDGSSFITVATMSTMGNLITFNDSMYMLNNNGVYKWSPLQNQFEYYIPSPMSGWFVTNNASRITVYQGHIHVVHNNFHYVLRNPRATLTFLAGNLLKEKRAIAAYGHRDGWTSASLRTWLNSDFVNTLPKDLQTALAEVKKLSDGGPNDPTLKETDDTIWVLSLTEVGGTDSNTVDDQGAPYAIFTDTSSRIRSVSDSSSPDIYWLRSSSVSTDGSFLSIDENGKSTKSSSFTNLHILIGFCI